MSEALQTLLRRLDLKAAGQDEFEGENEPNSWGRLFGGMVAAQSLVAACRTVEGQHLPHSLHAYFLRPGDPEQPVRYSVDRIRDGRSFTTRRVVAAQGDHAIFNMSASFHVEEEGYGHAFAMPDAPGPDSLKTWRELAEPRAKQLDEHQRKRFLEARPIDMRYTKTPIFLGGDASEGDNCVWFRAAGTLPDDLNTHLVVLTYASDMALLDNIARPHGRPDGSRPMQMASLDHSLWFHRRDLRADQWLLYHQDSPVAFGSRGLARGTIYDTAGRLVASVAQEGLMRPVKPR